MGGRWVSQELNPSYGLDASLLAAGAPYWGDGEIPRPAQSARPLQRDPARHSKKDPAKPTRAKANRPDSAPTDPALEQLLNPGIRQGTAGIGSQTGQRRAAARRAAADCGRRRTIPGTGGRISPRPTRRGIRPGRKVSTKPRSPAMWARPRSRPDELDPDLAKIASASTATTIRRRRRARPPARRRCCAASTERTSAWRRPPMRWKACCARAGGNSREQPWVPHRPPRPEKSEGGRRLVIKSDFEPKGDQPQAIDAAGRGHPAPRPQPGAARRHRLGQDLHHGQGDRGHPAPGPDHGAQQDAGGPALRRVPQLLPGQCGRVFRELLRLLPARSLCAAHRHLYREGILHQRADRPHAPFGHALAARARRRDHRGLGVVHLRHRLGRDLFGHDLHAQARRAHQPAPADRRPGVAAVQAHRRRLRARLVPGARRHARHLPGPLRGPRLAGEPVRRRGRIDQGVRSAHRPRDRRARLRQGLRQLALCDAAPDPAAGDLRHQAGAAQRGSTSSMPAAACWRRSGSSSAPCSISR